MCLLVGSFHTAPEMRERQQSVYDCTSVWKEIVNGVQIMGFQSVIISDRAELVLRVDSATTSHVKCDLFDLLVCIAYATRTLNTFVTFLLWTLL